MVTVGLVVDVARVAERQRKAALDLLGEDEHLGLARSDLERDHVVAPGARGAGEGALGSLRAGGEDGHVLDDGEGDELQLAGVFHPAGVLDLPAPCISKNRLLPMMETGRPFLFCVCVMCPSSLR